MPTYIVESYAAEGAVADQRDRAARAAAVGSGVTYGLGHGRSSA